MAVSIKTDIRIILAWERYRLIYNPRKIANAILAIGFVIAFQGAPAYAESCFGSAAIRYPIPGASTEYHISILEEIAHFESSNRKLGRHPITDEAPCCDYGRMGINRWWETQVTHKQWVTIISNDCSNVKFGAFLLQECVNRLGLTARGIGCYHSPTKKRAIDYGSAILERVGEQREARR